MNLFKKSMYLFLTLMIMISCIPGVQAKASTEYLENNERVETYTQNKEDVESQDLDGLLSIFDLSFNGDVHEYYSNSNVSGFLRFATSDSSGSLSNHQVRIKIPKDYTTRIKMGGGSIIDGEPKYTEDDTFEIVTANLNVISSGNDVSVPFNFVTRNKVIPKNEVITIFAEMLDGEGNIIKITQIDFINRIRDFKINIGGNHYVGKLDKLAYFTTEYKNVITVEAGKVDSKNPEYLSSDIDDLTPVVLGSYVDQTEKKPLLSRSGYRKITKQKLEFELPESALFIQEKNPAWTFDETSRIASITLEDENGFSMPHTNGQMEPSREYRLNIYFPSTKTGELHDFSLKHTLYPPNLGVNEEIITYEKSMQLRVERTSDYDIPKPGPDNSWSFSFRVDGSDIYYDNETFKKDFVENSKAILKASNNSKYNNTIENIKINIDEIPEEVHFDNIIIDSYDESVFEGTVNFYAIDRKGNRVDFLKNAKLDEKTFIVVGPQYATYHLESTPGSVLKAGQEIKVEFDLDITDYDKTTDVEVLHAISARGNAKYTKGPEYGYHEYVRIYHRPVNSRIYTYFTKWLNPAPGTTFYAGDSANLAFHMNAQDVLEGTVIDMQNVIVLLPEGVEYVPGSSKLLTNLNVIDFESDHSKYAVEPRVEYNYKNSGMSAIVWDMPKLTKINNNLHSEVVRYSFTVKFNNFGHVGTNEFRNVGVWGNVDEIGSQDDQSFVDIYDLNGNGRKDDILVSNSLNLRHVPAREIKVKKYVKGSLDHGYMRAPNIAMGEDQSKIDYRVDILNYSQVPYQNLEIIDVLPHVGDKTISKDANGEQVLRHSDHSVELTGKIEVPDGFTVYYSNEVPNYDNDDYVNSVTWMLDVEDYSKVRSIRIVMNEGVVLESLENVIIDFQGMISKGQELKNGDRVINTFGYSIGKNFNSGESNTATFEFVDYKVQGNIFNDFNEDSVFNDEDVFSNHLVTLVDKDKNPILNKQGNPIQDYTDENGFYELFVDKKGEYRILVDEPEDFDLTSPKMDDKNGSHILEGTNHSDLFRLDPSNRVLNRNAGYHSDDAGLRLTNIVVNAEDEILVNDILFEYVISFDEIPYNGLAVVDGVEMMIENGLVYLKGGSEIVIQDLDKDSTYKIIQTAVDHYKTTPEGNVIEGQFTDPIEEIEFKNMYISPVSDITVKKIWVGGPEVKPSIDIQLLRNGIAYGEIVTLENGTVEYTWENLPEYDLNGAKFTYTVEELDVHEDYESSINGFEIKNRFIERIPVIPLEPSKPKVPLTPLEPSKPTVPLTPLEPSKPTVPLTPLEPSKPTLPLTPLEPSKPVVPMVPLQPSQDQDEDKDKDVLPPAGVSPVIPIVGIGIVVVGLILVFSRKKEK